MVKNLVRPVRQDLYGTRRAPCHGLAEEVQILPLLARVKPGPRTLRRSLPRVPSPSVNERVSHGRDHVFTRHLCAVNFQLVARMGYQGLVFAVMGGGTFTPSCDRGMVYSYLRGACIVDDLSL